MSWIQNSFFVLAGESNNHYELVSDAVALSVDCQLRMQVTLSTTLTSE